MSGTRRARSSSGAGTAIASSPWIVVSIGVIVMVVLLIVALASARGRRPYQNAEPGPPAATMPLPGLPPTTASRAATSAAAPVLPGLSPRSTVLPGTGGPTPGPSGRAGAGGGSGRPAPPPRPPPPPAAPAAVTGRYGVVNTFDGGFIGEVRIVNADRTARDWTVRLVFPRGRLVAVWVSGAEQGSGDFADGVFTYRSGVDLAAGASVPLQFHFEDTGTTRPASCAVDGVGCAGL